MAMVSSGQAPIAAGASTDFRDVLLADLAGQPKRFGDARGGRPALVSFWAPWCESCVREAPALQKLSQQVGACGAAVLGVAVGENRQSVERFTHDRRIDFQQLTDPDFHLADALGQRRIPATLVLDAGEVAIGKAAIREALKGFLAFDEVRFTREIKAILKWRWRSGDATRGVVCNQHRAGR